MPVRYVPLLRWKRGERVALSKLSAAAKTRTTPLILIGSDQFKSKKATAKRAAIPAPANFIDDVISCWGRDQFFLDASPLQPLTGPHPLVAIAVQARAQRIGLIPATRLDAPLPYQQAVNVIYNLDKRGVCLRIDLQEMTSASSWIAGWSIPLNHTDLIIDFDEDIARVAALGPLVDAAFQGLHSGANWRSVTVSGTSVPENFSGFLAGLHTIPRAEHELWTRLRALKLPYDLDYGDYATVAPSAPPPGIAWGYPINVKYTLPAEFLVCRGVGTTGPKGVDLEPQLRAHANSIANYPARRRINCWADDVIDQIAAGSASTQNLEHWVQLSINRHIELMNAILP